MTIPLDDLAKATISLLIITDPLGNLPLFMAVTEGRKSWERRRTFTMAVVVAFGLLLIFTAGGSYILELFRVTLSDLQVAGGILLFIIAIRIVLFGHWTVGEVGQVSIVPLACPLLAGPGAITATLVLNASYGLLLTIFSLVLCYLVSWAILMIGEKLFQWLGETGSGIITQVMGLLLATIAVQFIRSGLGRP